MQPQQPNQNLILNNNQQAPLAPRSHHSTQRPTLSCINPFVIPGFNTPIALPRLAVTPIQLRNNVIPLADSLDNGSYFQGSGSVNTGHVYSMSENSTSIKIMLAILGCGPQNKTEVSHPALIPAVEG